MKRYFGTIANVFDWFLNLFNDIADLIKQVPFVGGALSTPFRKVAYFAGIAKNTFNDIQDWAELIYQGILNAIDLFDVDNWLWTVFSLSSKYTVLLGEKIKDVSLASFPILRWSVGEIFGRLKPYIQSFFPIVQWSVLALAGEVINIIRLSGRAWDDILWPLMDRIIDSLWLSGKFALKLIASIDNRILMVTPAIIDKAVERMFDVIDVLADRLLSFAEARINQLANRLVNIATMALDAVW